MRVAAKGEQARDRARRRRLRPSKLLVPIVVVVVGALYWQPLTTLLQTRGELNSRQTEVAELRAEKTRLEARLEQSESLRALGREARRLGYVRPGEQLFIVKGIDAWRRSHPGPSTVPDDGRP